MKITVTFFLLLFSTLSFAQLSVKSRGRVFDTYGKKMKPAEVRNRLAEKPEALALYNAGRNKKTIGNILLVTGAACIVGDYVNYSFQEYEFSGSPTNISVRAKKKFPSAIGIIGAVSLVVAIPVKLGHAYKVEKAIDRYNGKKIVDSAISLENLSICANQDGVGLRLNF
ncbi:MAG TPA: hypothetical protein PLS51_12635 [Flavobacterium sp.]|jgi:hypothetical protein|nr:hypothetical protein [Flavobacterium sp.]HPJ11474.1 hypothetical protein [Flavobacterium sp.]